MAMRCMTEDLLRRFICRSGGAEVRRDTSTETYDRRSLVEHALRDCERAVGRRDAAVDGALEQDLLQLVARQAVAERRPHVHRQLVLATRGDEGDDRDDAARPAVEPGARPDVAPRVAGDEVLEVRGEVGRAGARAVDVVVAEDLPA